MLQNDVLLPNEVAMVKRVFDDLVKQPWFDRTPENENAFASLVLHRFQQGMTVENILRRMCEHSAKKHFSKAR